MGRQLRLRLALGAAALVLLAAVGGIWYCKVYTKTPAYALRMTRQAVERHDKEAFHRYVDVERLTDSSYGELMEGLLDAEIAIPEEARSAIGGFTQLMKAPILASFREAADRYVETGSWMPGEEARESPGSVDISELLARSGLAKSSFLQVDGIEEDGDSAVAAIRIRQEEADSDFVVEAVLQKGEDGGWRVTGIRNFRDFVAMVSKARRTQLDRYLATTAEIMGQHDRAIREAELRYGDLLSSGSLGNDATRESIRHLMQDVIQKDWEDRKQELFSVHVPDAAQTLHHLRLRICDLHIDYAKSYALWMTDKKASTIREADSLLKQAKTLEQEAKSILRRMGDPAALPVAADE